MDETELQRAKVKLSASRNVAVDRDSRWMVFLWEAVEAILLHLESQLPHQHMVKSDEWLEPVLTTAEITGLGETHDGENWLANTNGQSMKPSQSFDVNPLGSLPRSALMAKTLDYFRSIGYIAGVSEVTNLDSSTLQLTLKLRLPSTPITADGDHGPADRSAVDFIREAGLPPVREEGS